MVLLCCSFFRPAPIVNESLCIRVNLLVISLEIERERENMLYVAYGSCCVACLNAGGRGKKRIFVIIFNSCLVVEKRKK